MTLVEALTLLPALGAGVLIAVLFFGGLWLTVGGLVRARRPALILIASLLVRLVLACGAFYLVARLGSWMHLLAATAGFLVMRLVTVRGLTPATAGPSLPAGERKESGG